MPSMRTEFDQKVWDKIKFHFREDQKEDVWFAFQLGAYSHACSYPPFKCPSCGCIEGIEVSKRHRQCSHCEELVTLWE